MAFFHIVLIQFFLAFIVVVYSIIPMDFSYTLEENFSYSSKNETSFANILLDSKSLDKQVAFLSTNLTQYFKIPDIKNFLYLTWIDTTTSILVKFKGFLDLTNLKINNSDIFYSSKIINLNPLNIFINFNNHLSSDQLSPILVIFTINNDNTLSVVNQIEFKDLDLKKDIIVTEGIYDKWENSFYILYNQCLYQSIPISNFSKSERKLLIINNNSTLSNFYLYEMFEAIWGRQNYLWLYFNHKQLIITTKGSTLIGISENNNLGTKYENCVIYKGQNNFGSNPANLNYISNCFEINNINKSFTRFLIEYKDNLILNIGTLCKESIPNCMNTYITLYLFNEDTNAIINSKILIELPSQLTNLSDAIISKSKKKLYILGNFGNYMCSKLFTILELDLDNDILPSSASFSNISSQIHPLYCEKIHELDNNLFALHCVSSSYRNYSDNCLGMTEIIYFLQNVNNVFIERFYFDNYHQKYYKISSYIVQNSKHLLAISTPYFCLILINESSSNIAAIEIEKENLFVQINSIIFIENSFYYGGCLIDYSNSLFRPWIFMYSEHNAYVNHSSLIQSQLYSCVKSLLLTDFGFFIAISTNVGINLNHIRILQSTKDFVIYEFIEFNSCHEEAPMSLIYQNQIVILSSHMNLTTSKRYIKAYFYYYYNSYLMQEVSFIHRYDVISNTFLINYNNEFTFGGSFNYSNTSSFWIGHYDLLGNLKATFSFGSNKGEFLTSSYIDKRVQSFSGYQNSRPMFASQFFDYTYSSCVFLISDYGTFLGSLNIFRTMFMIFSSQYLSNQTAFYYGIQNRNQVFSYQITSKIKCPSLMIIDEIEQGCFDECLSYVSNSNSQNCNPQKKGCSMVGKIMNRYTCSNDRLIINPYYSSSLSQIFYNNSNQSLSPSSNSYSPINISATMINYNQIQVTLNGTIMSDSDNVSGSIILIKNKKINSRNMQILNFSPAAFDEFVINLTNPSELECMKGFTLNLGKMNLRFLNGTIWNISLLSVKNVSSQPCNLTLSKIDEGIVTISNTGVSSVSSTMMAGNLLSFNPTGFISLLNCIDEIMLFQLLNCKPNYPENINGFINTTSAFSFTFLNNPLNQIFENTSIIQPSWLDNNIINHNALPSTSFIYNIMNLAPYIFLIFALIFLINLFTFTGFLFRRIRSYIHINYGYGIYVGIAYQICITSLANLFYDDNNYNFLTLGSSIISYITITFQILMIIFFLCILYINYKKLDNPDIQNLYGVLYENIIQTFPGIFILILNILKLQILLYLLFIFQEFPMIQFISIIIIYSLSLFFKMKFKPFQDFRDNLLIIIREGLFMILSITFGFYYILAKNKNELYQTLKQILIILMMCIFLNETVFSIINSISFIKNMISEPSLKGFYKLKQTYQYIKGEKVKHSKACFRKIKSKNNKIEMNIPRKNSDLVGTNILMEPNLLQLKVDFGENNNSACYMKKKETKINKNQNFSNSKYENNKPNENRQSNQDQNQARLIINVTRIERPTDNRVLNENEESKIDNNQFIKKENIEDEKIEPIENKISNENQYQTSSMVKVRRIEKPTDNRAFIDKLSSFEMEANKMNKPEKKENSSKNNFFEQKEAKNTFNEFSDTVRIYRKMDSPRFNIINTIYPLNEAYNAQANPYENYMKNEESKKRLNNSSKQNIYYYKEKQNVFEEKFDIEKNPVNVWNPNPYKEEKVDYKKFDKILSQSDIVQNSVQFRILKQ